MHTHTHTRVHMRMRTYLYAHINPHTHIHRHAHTQLYARVYIQLVQYIHTTMYVHTSRYGDIHPVSNMERIFSIAIMLSTYIAYGLILGRSAAILAGFTFRRQTFKRRFAIIRKYLVRLCHAMLILLHIHFIL